MTITGTPEAQWKSQYYIYDKIRQEGYAGDDEVRLRAEILVPTSLIGRLVGKGGHNVYIYFFLLISNTHNFANSRFVNYSNRQVQL